MSETEETAKAAAANGTPWSSRSATFSRTTVLPSSDRNERERSEDVRFLPIRPLGAGGMGEVLLVEDRDIGRQVAVKRVRASPSDDTAVRRFAEEVRTAGVLEHPGIAPVHDVGIDQEGRPYLVMKYVQGETLEQIIAKLREGSPAHVARFTYEVRARVFLSLLQTVRYAHERGILHRDIKPANVMVGPYGEVMLMDWGIAKRIEREAASEDLAIATTARDDARLVQTGGGVLLGTPLYMSPEQARGLTGALDERSDIYSLCLLLLELLLLEHPFASKRTPQELIIAQATEEIPQSRIVSAAMRVGAPCELAFFLAKGLAKNPDERFPSVRAMEEELVAVMAGKIPVTCHVTLAKRCAHETLRWIDRHALLYSLLFLAGIAAGAYGLITLVRRLLFGGG